MQMTIPLGVLTVGLLVKPKIRVVTTLPGEGVRVNAGSAIVGQGDSIPPPPKGGLRRRSVLVVDTSGLYGQCQG